MSEKNSFEFIVKESSMMLDNQMYVTPRGMSELNKFIDKYNHLEQENQKLKTLLDLAMGDEGLGFYGNPELYEKEWLEDYSYYDPTPPLRRTVNAHGKRARATREEILKQMEEM